MMAFVFFALRMLVSLGLLTVFRRENGIGRKLTRSPVVVDHATAA